MIGQEDSVAINNAIKETNEFIVEEAGLRINLADELMNNIVNGKIELNFDSLKKIIPIMHYLDWLREKICFQKIEKNLKFNDKNK